QRGPGVFIGGLVEVVVLDGGGHDRFLHGGGDDDRVLQPHQEQQLGVGLVQVLVADEGGQQFIVAVPAHFAIADAEDECARARVVDIGVVGVGDAHGCSLGRWV